MIFSRPGELASISQFVINKWLAYQDMQGGVREGKLNASPDNIRHRSYHAFIPSIIQLVLLLRLVYKLKMLLFRFSYDCYLVDSLWAIQTQSVYFQGVVSLCQCHQRSWTRWSFQNHHHSYNNPRYQYHKQSLFNWHHHYHQHLTSEKDFFVIFYTKKVEYMIARILPQRCWTSKIIGLNP